MTVAPIPSVHLLLWYVGLTGSLARWMGQQSKPGLIISKFYFSHMTLSTADNTAWSPVRAQWLSIAGMFHELGNVGCVDSICYPEQVDIADTMPPR